MTQELKPTKRQEGEFGPFQLDPELGLGYLDRATPPTPRTFAQTKAWATSQDRRRLVPATQHVDKITK